MKIQSYYITLRRNKQQELRLDIDLNTRFCHNGAMHC